MKKKRRWTPISALALIILLTVSIATGCGQQSGGQDAKPLIKIGYINWQEDVAVTYLWQEILQEKGYQVELLSVDAAPLFVGLNKGDLDLFLDSWLPITQQAYWEKYKDKLDDYGSWYTGEAKIGLAVPTYVNLDSITQLNDQKANFGGQIIGIDPGAGIMKSADKAQKDYALNYDIVQGSEAAMLAALDKAYKEKKPIVITAWSPHWMFSKYDLKYLTDPKKDFGSSEGLHVLANKDFTLKQPAVAAMLKKFKLNDQQIGTLEDLINQGLSPQDAAKKWISTNQTVVNSWLK
ncbi:glycine betaine ABC transporter substrate-binding protein [Desulfosporosinus sp. PR]|uniref:glycine betaine ABC transporter substrate-binding protein n=1 Tax=Candidatus Desulfosporosinus nitrosoreducens TaxID=3401928 RepID=UPI0027EB16D2|nr:glycine betaine ABC transporter substrate-binding protein [Desulfosporosinus sp. PR]MDQ7093303.1 glycine betaine ABC transporter substrate-binding protein [Desulfosporosinus sp. PR]